MSSSRYLTTPEMNDLKRRLRDYSATYPDSDFLDNSLSYADSGHVFTRENAAKIDDALRSWETRLNAPSYDPDRPPPGRDPHIWKLATLYRTLIEQAGWHCMSRRVIYAELARVIGRDKLRDDYAPWRDEPDAPGWYRMMTDVITAFVSDYTSFNAIATWYAHEQLAQPGEVTRVIGYLRDQAKLAVFDDRAVPASTRVPSAERRAQVRAYIQERKARG